MDTTKIVEEVRIGHYLQSLVQRSGARVVSRGMIAGEVLSAKREEDLQRSLEKVESMLEKAISTKQVFARSRAEFYCMTILMLVVIVAVSVFAKRIDPDYQYVVFAFALMPLFCLVHYLGAEWKLAHRDFYRCKLESLGWGLAQWDEVSSIRSSEQLPSEYRLIVMEVWSECSDVEVFLHQQCRETFEQIVNLALWDGNPPRMQAVDDKYFLELKLGASRVFVQG